MPHKAQLLEQSPEEEPERLLEDGVFPYVFGGMDENPPENVQAFDVDKDLELIKKGEGIVASRIRAAHDLLTWHHASSTPLGFHLLKALQAQSLLIQSCCLRLATHHPDFHLRVPLFPWFRANSSTWKQKVKAGDGEAEPLQVLVKSLRTWASMEQAIGVLGGSSSVTLRMVRNPVVLLDRWLGGTESMAVALPQGANPEDPACPARAGLSIGSNAITKGAARAASSLYVYRLEEAAKNAKVDFDGEPHYKGSVFDLRTLALMDEKLVGKRPPNEATLLTFLAASELALFSPLHPMFASLREGMRWNDLHPGFRLQRIFEVLKEKKIELRSTADVDYWKFTSSVCEALNWPDIPRFLDVARGSEKEKQEDNVAALFRAACILRETKPSAFLDPFEGVRHLAEVGPPTMHLASFETSGDADRALSFAMDAELYSLGFQLLFAMGRPTFQCAQYKGVVEQLEAPASLMKSFYGIEIE